MFSPECAHSRYIRRACVLGQLVRGIRFGDRRSAHMRSSAFADRSFKHPATIPLRAHPPPLAIRELLYCTEAKEWTTHCLASQSPAHMACPQWDPRVHSSVQSGQQLRSLRRLWVSLGDSPCTRACVQIDGTSCSCVRSLPGQARWRLDQPRQTRVLKALAAQR